MFGHLLVEGGITEECRNTNLPKKECDVSVLLEPEFMRPHHSRKRFCLIGLLWPE